MSESRGMRVTVVGFGAMGSGMAKRLHLTGHVVNVYDVDSKRVADFRAFKAAHPIPAADADIHARNTDESLAGSALHSDVVVICVLDEPQCEAVLEALLPGIADVSPAEYIPVDVAELPAGRVVSILVTSTVAPDYVAALPGRVCRLQAEKPSDVTYRVLDAPISGGPVRSEQGSLIVMVGAAPADVDRARPVLRSLTDYVSPGQSAASGGYYVCGPHCGDGMMVKICHQLIAGSNLACAAEGYALANACGVYSDVFVEICTRGAASSFMLQNRGGRIGQALTGEDPPCMSSVAVWKKDLGIVRDLAGRHGLRGRMFEAALQGFLDCGARFGFDRDDSCFTRMLTDDAQLSAAAGFAQAVEVGDEPRHRIMLENEYVRAINVKIAEGDETLIHTHTVDSLYFFIVPPATKNVLGANTMQVINTIYDTDTNTVTSDTSFMTYGECRFGNHCCKPLVHKIKCVCSGNGKGAHCVDVELKKSGPVLSGMHEAKCIDADGVNVVLVKEKDKALVFQLTVRPGCTYTFESYFFYYLVLVMQGGESTITRGSVSWPELQIDGECTWHAPAEALWTVRNDCTSNMVFFIIQWK